MKRSNKKVKFLENCKKECSFEEAVRYIACGLLPKQNGQIPIEDDNLSENEKIELDNLHEIGSFDVFLQDQINKEFSNRMSEVYSIEKNPYYEDENFYLKNFDDVDDFEKNYKTDNCHEMECNLFNSVNQKSSLEESLKQIALYEKEKDSQYIKDKKAFLQYIDNQEKYDSIVDRILMQHRENLLFAILQDKIKTSGIKDNDNQRSNIESSEWNPTRNFNYEENSMSVYNNTVTYKDILIDFQDVFNLFPRKITNYDERVIRERKEGGKNSYQDYKSLKIKVEELCKIELSKRKNLSARQLSHIVAKIVEEKHKDLLKDFEPYNQIKSCI